MRELKLMLLAMTLTVLGGCTGSSALIKAGGTSVRTDVFQELTTEGQTPRGMADLHFTGMLKTHKPGVYSAKDIHGTPDYTLLLNIDGQAVVLRGTLREEADGVTYRFGKNLRLKAGDHRIVVALPGDGIAVEKEIALAEGDANHLVLEPIYGAVTEKKRPSAYRISGFEEGIKGISLTFNGRSI